MLFITRNITIPAREIDMQAVRSQGAGGQNVNKVSTAIHLRFDIKSSSLPELYKTRLLALQDSRITGDGIIVIKSQEHKSQAMNREAALQRLATVIRQATVQRKPRRPTSPTAASKRRRLEQKVQRGRTKTLRQKVDY